MVLLSCVCFGPTLVTHRVSLLNVFRFPLSAFIFFFRNLLRAELFILTASFEVLWDHPSGVRVFHLGFIGDPHRISDLL